MLLARKERCVVSTEDLRKLHKFSGVSVYKSIVVLFDEDFDDRIFTFLKEHHDSLTPWVKAVYESEGTVHLFSSNVEVSTLKDLEKNSVLVEQNGWHDEWQVFLVDLTKETITINNYLDDPFL